MSFVREFEIVGDDFAAAGRVSTDIKATLQQVGYATDVIRRTAIAVYEAEMNVVMYARKARLRLTLDPDLIHVELDDEGPGIQTYRSRCAKATRLRPTPCGSAASVRGWACPTFGGTSTRSISSPWFIAARGWISRYCRSPRHKGVRRDVAVAVIADRRRPLSRPHEVHARLPDRRDSGSARQGAAPARAVHRLRDVPAGLPERGDHAALRFVYRTRPVQTHDRDPVAGALRPVWAGRDAGARARGVAGGGFR